MANHYPNLKPEKALIWRIFHHDNLPGVLNDQLSCGKVAVNLQGLLS